MRAVKRIVCNFLGHNYYVYAKPKEDWAVGIRWLKCSRCSKSFAMNDRVRTLLPMDFELKDLHEWEKIKEAPCEKTS